MGDRFKDPWDDDMWYFACTGPLFVAEDVMAAARRALADIKDSRLFEKSMKWMDPHPPCMMMNV